MRIISLRKFLDQAGRAGSSEDCARACLGFADALCREIGFEPAAEESGPPDGPGAGLFAELLERVRQSAARHCVGLSNLE
ncbi:MAG: hypothetical protein NZR01_01715 [Bryobacteraceae bacterium]|nr:hypothetical protein [Bryobacteraceae bacterium]